MGLDMYLYKHTYVQNWRHMDESELHKITVKEGGKIRKDIKPERIAYIIEQVGYWRKFNALHNWFVKECQKGIDECQTTYISRENLGLLLKTLKSIRDDHSLAGELLPTASGFFFGSSEVDEYYFKEIVKTIELLEEELKTTNGDYYYRSSW